MSVTVKSKLRIFCEKVTKHKRYERIGSFAGICRTNEVDFRVGFDYVSLVLHIPIIRESREIWFRFADCTNFNDCFAVVPFFPATVDFLLYNLKFFLFSCFYNFTRQSKRYFDGNCEMECRLSESTLKDRRTLLSRYSSLL